MTTSASATEATEATEANTNTESVASDDSSPYHVSDEEEEDDEAAPQACDRCGAPFAPVGSPDFFTPLHCILCNTHLCEECSEGSANSYACDVCACAFEDLGDGHSACSLCVAAEIETICCGCPACKAHAEVAIERAEVAIEQLLRVRAM